VKCISNSHERYEDRAKLGRLLTVLRRFKRQDHRFFVQRPQTEALHKINYSCSTCEVRKLAGMKLQLDGGA
jgi:hypothetical protein